MGRTYRMTAEQSDAWWRGCTEVIEQEIFEDLQEDGTPRTWTCCSTMAVWPSRSGRRAYEHHEWHERIRHTGASAYDADPPRSTPRQSVPAWRPNTQQAGQGLVLSTPARRWFLVPAQRPLMADRRRSGHCGTAERMSIDHAKIGCGSTSRSWRTCSRPRTQDEMTPAEVLCTVTRVFAWLAAARASMVAAGHWKRSRATLRRTSLTPRR